MELEKFIRTYKKIILKGGRSEAWNRNGFQNHIMGNYEKKPVGSGVQIICIGSILEQIPSAPSDF